MRNPCRIHAEPTQHPCRIHAKTMHNSCSSHADHTRIRVVFFAAFAPQLDDEHVSLKALELLLPSRLATCLAACLVRRLLRSDAAEWLLRSGVSGGSGQAARNASSKAVRSSFRNCPIRAATTASCPPWRSCSKHARNEERARLPSLTPSCGNLRLVIGSSRKLRRPRRGYEGLGYETGYETGMKRV